jgi:glycine cleavage system aminomethyltransferase T
VNFEISIAHWTNLDLEKNVAMGYVDKQDSKVGTELEVDFGTKSGKVVVSKLPFVDTKYYIPKKTN